MTKTYAVDNCGRSPVVVGVDGSVSAQAALTWAAAEAWSRRCPLRIIHTFSCPMIGNTLDLGSVSQAVLHHAACPVAVVHPHRTKSLEPLPVRRPRLQIAAPSRLAELKERS